MISKFKLITSVFSCAFVLSSSPSFAGTGPGEADNSNSATNSIIPARRPDFKEREIYVQFKNYFDNHFRGNLIEKFTRENEEKFIKYCDARGGTLDNENPVGSWEEYLETHLIAKFQKYELNKYEDFKTLYEFFESYQSSTKTGEVFVYIPEAIYNRFYQVAKQWNSDERITDPVRIAFLAASVESYGIKYPEDPIERDLSYMIGIKRILRDLERERHKTTK